jgi:hypothetical protein
MTFDLGLPGSVRVSDLTRSAVAVADAEVASLTSFIDHSHISEFERNIAGVIGP